MYFDIWGPTPAAATCAETRFAVGFMAMTCFYVAFMCVGMGFGGYTDDGEYVDAGYESNGYPQEGDIVHMESRKGKKWTARLTDDIYLNTRRARYECVTTRN